MLALEHSPAALGLATLAGDLLYLNSKAEQLFQLAHGASLAGRNFADICTGTAQLTALEAVARDGHDRHLHLLRGSTSAGPKRYLCRLVRVAGDGAIPAWLAFAALEDDGHANAADVALDDAQSMSIIRRLTGIAAWKMRVADLQDWTHNSIQWGGDIYTLLNVKPADLKPQARDYLDFVARADREEVSMAMEQSLRSGARFEAVYQLSPRGGPPKVVLSRAVLVADNGDGAALAMLGVVQDITPVFAGQLPSHEKAAILDTVVGNMEAPVYAVDPELRYVYFNPFFVATMRQLYGVDTTLGEKAFGHVPDGARRRVVLANLRRALGGIRVVEEIVISPDSASKGTYELTYSQIGSGTLSGGVVVFGARVPGTPV